MLNRQLVFDTATAHLLTQRERATPDTKPNNSGFNSNNCKYRMQKEGRTLKCAMGALIPDEQYSEAFEGRRIGTIACLALDPKFGDLYTRDREFLDVLQTIHDAVDNTVDKWPQLLAKFAREWNLDSSAALREYPFNRQLAFDRIARHLLTQNEKARADYTRLTCRYRTDAGLKCAIGALIPDEEYNEDFEGSALHTSHPLLAHLQKDLGKPRDEDVYFLRTMQQVHDTADVAMWPAELCAKARVYGLNDAVVKELRPNG